MVGNDFVNDTFLAFLYDTPSGQKHAATKYHLESREPPQILFSVCYQPPAPYLGFFLPSERSSVVVEMTDVVIEWDTLYYSS